MRGEKIFETTLSTLGGGVFVLVLLVIELYYIMITCISDILLLNRDVYR